MWRAQASSSSSSSRWMSSDISGMSLPHHPPPAFLDEEMAVGVQNATQLFLNHGLGKRKLELIAKEKERSLVDRWQEMMGAFLGSQAHVLAGLGYEASEQGIGMYNQHLSLLMQSADPDTQEKLRIKGRDTWRQVLLASFDVPQAHVPTEELSIVDARNITHKVSQKMQDPEILDIIAKRCQEAKPASGDGIQAAHMIVQDCLVNNVYLGGDPSLVVECGFPEGETGYICMQYLLAEHQADPLVAQYIGSALMKVFQSAGIGPGAPPPPS